MFDKNAPLRSFGRRKGRQLRPTKQGLFESLLPKLEISLEEAKNLNPDDKNWLEIGFGGGEHLAHQAGLHPEVKLIGCEPYINGIAGLLTHIDEHKISNIRIYSDDARQLIDALPNACLERVFILYPDPWLKSRHKKRRIISMDFLDSLARVIKNGGELRLATDSADYATWMLERLLAHKNFQWQAKTYKDWLNPPQEWTPTRYEQKALAGIPTYLGFNRIDFVHY